MKLPTDQDDWNRESSSEGDTAIHSCKNQETYFEPNFANTAHKTAYSTTVPFESVAFYAHITMEFHPISISLQGLSERREGF